MFREPYAANRQRARHAIQATRLPGHQSSAGSYSGNGLRSGLGWVKMASKRRRLDPVGPFGNPDGSRADIEDVISQLLVHPGRATQPATTPPDPPGPLRHPPGLGTPEEPTRQTPATFTLASADSNTVEPSSSSYSTRSAITPSPSHPAP